MTRDGLIRAVPERVEVARTATGFTFRGVASTIGNVDRMGRCFLPGAFGSKQIKVPLLAFHDDQRPVGSSVLRPSGNQLLHESKLSAIKGHDDIVELIQDGGIPATSIGWMTPEQDRYYGWKELSRKNAPLARLAVAAGVPEQEDVAYYASTEVFENSLVPIPANPMALLSLASMTGAETGMVEAMMELAAGARHSTTDQAAIQRAHDALTEAGAMCQAQAAPVDASDGETPDPDDSGITGGWYDNMRSAAQATETAAQVAARLLTAADKPAYSMPDGSYPISTCAEVTAAANLAHHSKTYSFAEVKAHVLKAKSGLGCEDSVLPDSWKSQDAAAALDTLPIDDLATELAVLKAR